MFWVTWGVHGAGEEDACEEKKEAIGSECVCEREKQGMKEIEKRRA